MKTYRLKSVRIRNFMSFGEAAVEFGPENLVLVSGKVSGSENSNGAGKSSLLESIYWAYTGSSVRGIKAAEVVRGSKKVCKVRVCADFKGTELCVTREYGDKKSLDITLDGKTQSFHNAKDGTEQLFAILGCTPKQFELMLFYGRLYSEFVDMSNSDRADLIEALVDSSKWDEAHTKTAQAGKRSAAKSASLVEELNTINSEMEHATKTIEGKIAQKKEFLAEAEKTGKSLTSRLSDLEEKKEDTERKKRHADEEYNVSVKHLDDLPRPAELDKIAEIEAELKSGSLWKEQDEKHRSQQEECAKLERAIHDGICEACKRPFGDDTEVATMKTKLKEARASALAQGDLLESLRKDKTNDAESRIATLRSELEKDEVAVKKLRKERDVRHQRVQDLAKELLAVETEISEVKAKQAALQEGANIKAVEATIATLEEQRVALEQRRGVVHKNSEEAAENGEDYKQLAAVFKDVRYNLFEKALKAIEADVNVYCRNSGLDFDKVVLSPYRELANGNKKAEISIVVERAGSPMNLNSLSDGERRRLSLSFFFSLNKVVASLVGFEMTTMILDEPLTGLDSVGKQNAFDLLAGKAGRKQIFVIDHAESFGERFEKFVVVSKDAAGVSTIA